MAMKSRDWQRTKNGRLTFTELGFGTAPLGNLYRAIGDDEAQAQGPCGKRVSCRAEFVILFCEHGFLRVVCGPGGVGVEGVAMSELEPRLAAMKPLSLDKRDGIRLSFADGWLLIRASGTEPKVRVTAEAKSRAQAEELYNSGIRIVKECSREGREGSL